jgi:Asp/Glu/hydantoin racemase
MDDSGLVPGKRQEIFFLSTTSSPCLGLAQSAIQQAITQGKQLGCEADSPPSTEEVKDE